MISSLETDLNTSQQLSESRRQDLESLGTEMKKLEKVKEANIQLVQQLKDSKEQCDRGNTLYSDLEQVYIATSLILSKLINLSLIL